MSAKVFHPIPHDLKEGCLAMDGRRNGLHIPKRRKVWHSVIQAQVTHKGMQILIASCENNVGLSD